VGNKGTESFRNWRVDELRTANSLLSGSMNRTSSAPNGRMMVSSGTRKSSNDKPTPNEETREQHVARNQNNVSHRHGSATLSGMFEEGSRASQRQTETHAKPEQLCLGDIVFFMGSTSRNLFSKLCSMQTTSGTQQTYPLSGFRVQSLP
jgi:hypothetical protein